MACERMRARRRWLLSLALMWSVALIGGALALRVLHPERWLPLLGRLGRHEAVHVVAHVVLYGTLAAACVRLSRRPWVPLAVVAGVGLLQEAAQSSFGKGMGAAEAFDLAVDLAAAAAVTAVTRALSRSGDRASRPVSDDSRGPERCPVARG
jgi:hypothetical protein